MIHPTGLSRMMALLAGLALTGAAHAQETLTHVHGLSYSADGKRLMIPRHHGVAVYESGKWSKAPGPQLDYMGFAATAGSLYAIATFNRSVYLSEDAGRSWKQIAERGAGK
jgi:hypothetical protein